LLHIDKKISSLPIWRYIAYTAVARWEVTFVDAINVNNNKMLISANDNVSIQLVRQEKE